MKFLLLSWINSTFVDNYWNIFFDLRALSFNAFATEIEALIIGLRSGFKLSIGVGTVIMKTSESEINSILLVK